MSDHRDANESPQEARHGGCLVMLTVALILLGLFYGILWGLQGAYLGDMSPRPPSQVTPPTPGAQP